MLCFKRNVIKIDGGHAGVQVSVPKSVSGWRDKLSRSDSLKKEEPAGPAYHGKKRSSITKARAKKQHQKVIDFVLKNAWKNDMLPSSRADDQRRILN
jgi:hypothetical protein